MSEHENDPFRARDLSVVRVPDICEVPRAVCAQKSERNRRAHILLPLWVSFTRLGFKYLDTAAAGGLHPL